MTFKHYLKRVLLPIIIVFLFYIFNLLISNIDSKDRALLLIIIGHCYGIVLATIFWILFKAIGSLIEDSIKRNIISIIFLSIGFYFIVMSIDYETIIASCIFIIVNLFVIITYRA